MRTHSNGMQHSCVNFLKIGTTVRFDKLRNFEGEYAEYCVRDTIYEVKCTNGKWVTTGVYYYG